MNMIAVIPARYESSRFPGKPLADICGKPMIWWVFNQVKKVNELSEVYIATEDTRIYTECKKFGINVVMTSKEHKSVFNRIGEFANKVPADGYVVINGDEPLIKPEHIRECIYEATDIDKYVYNAIAPIKFQAQTNDISNIKVIFDKNNTALYMSRTPVPFPYKSMNFSYWKHVGITVLNKNYIDFYNSTEKGYLENIEGIDHLRFIEHKQIMKFVKLEECETLSVDTPNDLEIIKEIILRSNNENEN